MSTGEQKKLNAYTQKLWDRFVERLNAGLPLTLGEWNKLGVASKEVWEACYSEWRIKNVALQSHFIADTMMGGRLATEAVWDILPTAVQEKFLNLWSKENAKQD